MAEKSIATAEFAGQAAHRALIYTRLSRDQGDRTAAALLEESLVLRRDLGDKQGIAESLEELAGVATHSGQPERAARLFGAAEALRQAIGAPLPPADQAAHDRGIAAARARLGEQGFAAAWADGRAMPIEGA